MNEPFKFTDNQYNGLNKILRRTGCDIWFYIKEEPTRDCIIDLEVNREITLKGALKDLYESITLPLDAYGLTPEEIDEIKILFYQYGYKLN